MEGETGFVLVMSDSINAYLQRLVVPGEMIWAFVTVHGLVPGTEPYWVSSLDEFGTTAEATGWQKVLSECSAAD
jgi:hypothetical protein